MTYEIAARIEESFTDADTRYQQGAIELGTPVVSTCATASETDPAIQAAPPTSIEISDTDMAIITNPSWLSTAMSFGLSFHDAQELIQETVIKFLRFGDRIKAQPGERAAWFWVVLRNGAMSMHRKKRPQLGLTPDEVNGRIDMSLASSFEDGLVGSLAVEQALTSLPERQRAIVALRFLEGLSVAQTAELLNIAEGTVKSQASRGLDALRGLMGVKLSGGA